MTVGAVTVGAVAGTDGWAGAAETSKRYRLYSFISAMRFAPYSGSVAYTPVRLLAKASGTARSAMARV